MQTSLQNVPPFLSPPCLLNGHFHTIIPSLFHHRQKPPVKRINIPTPDEDFLEIDVMDAQNNKPVISLFHGLEGSSDRYYMIDLMNLFVKQNYSVVAVNFRSCGSRLNRRRRFYHSGETKDLHTVFLWIKEHFPQSKIGAVGFSLGGNALLKYLGENGRSQPLKAAVAVSVPYHLKNGSIRIHQGFNRLYEYLFVRSLRKKLNQKRKTFTDLPSFHDATLYQFDDEVTAPVHGFDDAEDYYRRCSSNQFIGAIRTPALLIHSREDPLCPVGDMPLRQIKQNKFTDYMITEKGGHVGFLSRPAGWLNKVIVNYFDRKFIN